MAAYTRSILEPLVARLAEQETIIRDQAETVGSLRAQLAAAEEWIGSLEALQSPVAPNLGAQTPDPPFRDLRAPFGALAGPDANPATAGWGQPVVAALVAAPGRLVSRPLSLFGRSRRLSLVMAPKTTRPPSDRVGRPRPRARGSALVAQGRLVDTVAGGTVLFGRIDELAGQLDVSAAAFRAALQELTAARWIVAQTGAADRLTVRWERRQYQVAVPVERRRQHAC